jgi:KipI family sensor histidine kinase inhibitor
MSIAEDLDPRPGEIRSMGEHALLVGVDGPAAARAIVARVTDRPDLEAVAGLRSVLVTSTEPLEEGTVTQLFDDHEDVPSAASMTHHKIPIVFDGADLDEASNVLALSTQAIITMLLETTLEVAMLGFSPGFGYLTGLEGPLATLERRATPRPRVPAGSLAVAGSMAALYPDATPGGWWLLGRTDVVLFDQNATTPALLQPGDTVSFIQAASPNQRVPAVRPPVRRAEGTLEVVATPPWITVVDHPRSGVAGMGIPASGPFDPERAALVRRLVGTSDGSLEVTGIGLELRAHAPCTVAAVDLVITVDGRTVPPNQPLGLGAGQALRVEGLGRGHRGYLAMTGGPGGPEILGSRGTDVLSRVGPGPLEVGDRLVATTATAALPAQAVMSTDGPVSVLRVTEGPHVHALPEGVAQLANWHAVVGDASSKVGIRLMSGVAPLISHRGAITSIPVVTGAVQCPPDGTAIVLGPDHATVGGYPVVAVVIDADLPILGRLCPGDEVRVAVVSRYEAAAARQARVATLAAALSGVSPSGDDQGRLASWG